MSARFYTQLFTCLVSAWIFFTGCHQTAFTQTENIIPADCHLSYVLPINVTTNPKIQLVVKTPEDMSTQSQDIQTFMREKESSISYNPKCEKNEKYYSNAKCFSRAFRIIKFVGRRMSARQFANETLLCNARDSLRFDVIRNEIITEETYERSIMLFQTQSGLNVLIGYIATYSGPYDTCGVEYSELYDTWLEGAALEQKAKEITQTISTLVHVLPVNT